MLKDALYQGLHGPLSRDAILASLAHHPALTLHSVVDAATGDMMIQVVHHTTHAVHTLLYEPDEEPGLLCLLAVMATRGS